MLDLAHSDVGQLKLVCEWLDLREILKDISVIGEQFAHDKGLTWTFEMQKNLPRVWGDGTRLRQVMLNLVTNAVKFTSCGEVGMTATAKDGFLTVGIHDTGLGISEDEQDLIFDEFRQSDRTTARGFGGLGLGLAICKRLVEMHGGEIGVYSSGEEGEGSTFYFTLPTKERPVALAPGGIPLIDYLTKPIGTAELAETLTAQGLLDKDGKNGAEKKILIVDDEPGILNLHTRIVQAQSPDYQVLQARSGLEALKIIREERPDLVLLDLMMPEVDGYAVLDAMRSEELSRDTPVIVLTGQALTDEDMVRLNVTAASVLGKGMFSVEETLNHINSALSHKRRVGPDAQRIVLKAMAYIHANYPEPISRKDVAEYVGLSERHLNRCFMQEIGISPMTYLNRFRVRQAKQLLQSGEKGITEIALDVGFTSSAYFTRVFREEVGVSPRTYLKGRCSELNV